jgi:hypothetical protein
VARHIWSVLCERVLQDHETKQISLLNVTDSVVVEPVTPPTAGEVGVRLDLLIVSHWVRDGSTLEARARIDVHSPEGVVSRGRELTVDLTADERTYTVSRVEVLPLNGLGRYEFAVHCRHGDEWSECCKLPLDLSDEPISVRNTTPPISE